jgi:hypothetical protein
MADNIRPQWSTGEQNLDFRRSWAGEMQRGAGIMVPRWPADNAAINQIATATLNDLGDLLRFQRANRVGILIKPCKPTQTYHHPNLRGIMGQTDAEDNIRFSHQRIQRTGVVEPRSLGACLTGRTATRAEPAYRLAGIHHGAGAINWSAAPGSAPNLPFNNHQSVISRDPNRIGVVSELKRSTHDLNLFFNTRFLQHRC